MHSERKWSLGFWRGASGLPELQRSSFLLLGGLFCQIDQVEPDLSHDIQDYPGSSYEMEISVDIIECPSPLRPFIRARNENFNWASSSLRAGTINPLESWVRHISCWQMEQVMDSGLEVCPVSSLLVIKAEIFPLIGFGFSTRWLECTWAIFYRNCF